MLKTGLFEKGFDHNYYKIVDSLLNGISLPDKFDGKAAESFFWKLRESNSILMNSEE